MTNPRPLLIGQFGVFPGRHIEIRRGFELCGVLSFLRRSLDSLPGLLSLFPLVTNFPSPRSNSRSRLLELTSVPDLHKQLGLVPGSWRNSFGLGDLGFPLFREEEPPVTGPLPVMKA